jgi:hypothetical protein
MSFAEWMAYIWAAPTLEEREQRREEMEKALAS